MNTDTGARQELASAPAVLSERHPACSDPVKLRMTRTIGTRAMRPLARWVLGIVVTGMLLGPEAVRADGSLQIPVAGDASLNGMVWTERRDNGFVWSGSFPFTFHALADVNGDGFADLIYTVRPIHFRLILPVPRPLTSMSSIPTVPASVPRWWWRPTPVPRSGCAAAHNGFVWSGSFPFTFHALADVNGDGFADLIYTVPANPLSPYPSGTSAPNVYVQYSNGASFGPPVVVATDSSATVRVCSSTGRCQRRSSSGHLICRRVGGEFVQPFHCVSEVFHRLRYLYTSRSRVLGYVWRRNCYGLDRVYDRQLEIQCISRYIVDLRRQRRFYHVRR